jgi:hypothetical protein
MAIWGGNGYAVPPRSYTVSVKILPFLNARVYTLDPKKSTFQAVQTVQGARAIFRVNDSGKDADI